MEMNAFGTKVRQLREEKGLTREAFCEDELDLTVRQLTRIESGESKPTLLKINYIASRLGVSLAKLMPDYVEIPSGYLNLKYSILRTPSYGEEKLLTQKDEVINRIYDNFYDELPDEEKLIVDTLRSMADVYVTQDAQFGKVILDDYFYQIINKSEYNINDLVVLQLYFLTLGEVSGSYEFNKSDFDHIVAVLLKLTENFSSDVLFVLRDVLLLAVNCGRKFNYTIWSNSIFNSLNEIMARFQDFQKKPILNMLMWQYFLFIEKDSKKAEELYAEAILFAGITNQNYLVDKLNQQWFEDNQ